MTQQQGPDGRFPTGVPDTATVREWLVAYVANLLEFDRSEVRPQLPLGRYGLGSTAAVALTGDLGEWLGCYVDPTVLYKHKSIDALAEYVVTNYQDLRGLLAKRAEQRHGEPGR